MLKPPSSAAFACAAALAACSPPPMDTAAQALTVCSRSAGHDEIRDAGTITRVLGTRGAHLGFIVRLEGRTYRVEDNTDITGPVPLHRGEPVELQGQFECNDYVIHWTHRDPAGRHIAGYIEADGKTYQ